MIYKCKYCNKEFDSKYKLAGHSTRCKMNPNYEENIIKCNKNLNNYNSSIKGHKEETLKKYQNISTITKEELQILVKQSTTYMDVLIALEYKEKGGVIYKILKQKIYEYNIDTSHFLGKAHGKSRSRTYELNEVFVQNSTYKGKLINLLINNCIRPYKCECCGITEWNGKKITLQVHHVNGNHNDNRLENLQILCPNCHSQTDNFGGANVKQWECSADGGGVQDCKSCPSG